MTWVSIALNCTKHCFDPEEHDIVLISTAFIWDTAGMCEEYFEMKYLPLFVVKGPSS